MKLSNHLGTLAAAAVGLSPAAAPAKNDPQAQFSGERFDINRDNIQLTSIGKCAKSTAYFIPTTYVLITARSDKRAGGGLGKAQAKARVFLDGVTKTELQGLAAGMQSDIVAALKAEGFKVLTVDDVPAAARGKALMKPNPRYGMPTREERNFPGQDFVVATPTDALAFDYGLFPNMPWQSVTKDTGATLLVPIVYLTVPQLAANASTTIGMTYKTTSAEVKFDPAMKLAGGGFFSLGCILTIGFHGSRLPVPVAGNFQNIGTKSFDFGDWGQRKDDFLFVIDNAAFDTGVARVGKSLARLTADLMAGR